MDTKTLTILFKNGQHIDIQLILGEEQTKLFEETPVQYIRFTCDRAVHAPRKYTDRIFTV